jgi:hypothetical protein
MFCSQCGSKLELSSKFCSNCGSRTENEDSSSELEAFNLSDLRVPYGSATQDTLPLSEQDKEIVQLPGDSELALKAKSPFDPNTIPSEGDMVPLNCAWAFVRHPGPIPATAESVFPIDKKFVGMGVLSGRTFSEIVSVVGPPMTKVSNGAGLNAVWGKTGFFSVWQIALNFDPYGVCISIYSETNI